ALVLLTALVARSAAADSPVLPAPDRPVDFSRDVLPIFRTHCHSCHGPKRQRGGLRLDVKAAALQGGGTHAPVILPGKGEESPLVRAVAGLDDDLVMPPREEGRGGLSRAEVGLLRAWIDQGAVWPDGTGSRADDSATHWSLRPLRRPAVPAVRDGSFGAV